MIHLRITQRHYMAGSEKEKNVAFDAKQNRFWHSGLPFISYIALGKSFIFSESPISSLIKWRE